MNRILFQPEELSPDGIVRISDSRAEHILTILHGEVGQLLKTGIINGKIGTSKITAIEDRTLTLSSSHTEDALEPWIDLLLAMPRPKTMKRLWPQLATLGVRRLFLLEAEKVEKCYFGCQTLIGEKYKDLLIEGLMQAGTSRLPEVTIIRNLKRFLNQDVERIFAEQPVRLIAHPDKDACPSVLPPCVDSIPALAIGPEGGWTDEEIDLWQERRFRPFSLGPRILRTDTACIGLLSILGYEISLRKTKR